MSNPFHLVVRFSDTMFGVGDVIAIHNAIVTEHDAVWFGKLGQTFSQNRIDMLAKQIKQGIPTYLYLVKGNRKKSTAYRAKLVAVSRDKPKEKKLIPAYYGEKKLLQYMQVWMKISRIDPIEMSQMESLKAINSVFPISETLQRSSSGYFLVHESKSIF